jgi:CelD/BcsL family acetyltransferase involved in cellulose biosynthesis
MKVHEVRCFEDWSLLERTWNSLLERCDHSIFSTWEWLTIWWKHFGKDKQLLILVAEDDNGVVGIAPLMYSVVSLFGARRGKIEFIGTQESDYNGFIIAEQQEQCLEAFFEYLQHIPENWNYIRLTDISEEDRCLNFLVPQSRNVKTVENCPYLILPNSFDLFIEQLSYKKRKYVRRGLRKLEESFKVEFSDYSDPKHCAEGMQHLFVLHQKKWTAIGQIGVFSDSAIRNFHLEIAEVFSKKNWLFLSVLKLSEKPVAAEYGFRYNSKYYAYLPGVDPDFSKYSVGNMLFILIVEKLIKEGIGKYDFLRGAEQYKDYWNAISKLNYQVTLSKRCFSGRVGYLFSSGYWNLGYKLKYILKI